VKIREIRNNGERVETKRNAPLTKKSPAHRLENTEGQRDQTVQEKKRKRSPEAVGKSANKDRVQPSYKKKTDGLQKKQRLQEVLGGLRWLIEGVD